MNGTLASLQSNELSALEAYTHRLSADLGKDLCHLWFFGSKSRGDSHPESDIDLLVAVRNLQPEKRWRIRQIAAQCSLAHDVLLNTHILDQKRWDEIKRHKGTLWREVRQHGVSLLEIVNT